MAYIWAPKSHTNPNLKITPFPQSSSSNPLKTNRNKKNKAKRNKKRRNRNRNRNRNKLNWLDLPEDVWFRIFETLCTVDILNNVQMVCKLFHKICMQPSLFRIINMTLPDEVMGLELEFDVNIMTRCAVDRSMGQLVDVYLEYHCDDATLMYILDRSKNLKHLRMGHLHIPTVGLIEAVKKLPMLEEVEIIICGFPSNTYEALGHACPSLKSFSLNTVGFRNGRHNNEEVHAIAKGMPNLRRLQLIGNSMTNEGLKAILDGSPLLESLDLRACFNIDLSGDLGKRCDKIKNLRRPDDSTADYNHKACINDSDLDLVSDSSDSYPGYLNNAERNMYPDYFDEDEFGEW